MAKFSGIVGYGEAAEDPDAPGSWRDEIVERRHYGDVIRNSRYLNSGEHLNSDITVGNSISIVADAYANNHFFAIRFVEWMGASWIVTKVDVEPPRLILRLGGVYNGPRQSDQT